jgi:hypothetical protein
MLPSRTREAEHDLLHVSKQPEAAVAVLHNDVLPFYARLDLPTSMDLVHPRWPADLKLRW